MTTTPNILEEIAAHKRKEIAERMDTIPVKLLQKSVHYNAPTVSLAGYLNRKDKSGVIAEFKRKSPSVPDLHLYAEAEQITIGYMRAGASALSVLTDQMYFGGNLEDLKKARKFNFCPVLRKDFMLNAYQIHEARSAGADAILLIASLLSKNEVSELTKEAMDLGMEVLLEVHNETEIDHWNPQVKLIGVNNRNLKTFETHISHSLELFSKLPKEAVKVSESGIKTPEGGAKLLAVGFNGLLIGGQFMADARPERACLKFIKALNQLNGKAV
jgi:indole-3-glycerol phosphate synthase